MDFGIKTHKQHYNITYYRTFFFLFFFMLFPTPLAPSVFREEAAGACCDVGPLSGHANFRCIGVVQLIMTLFQSKKLQKYNPEMERSPYFSDVYKA